MATLAGKLLRLGSRGWLDLMLAQVALLRAWARLRWTPVGTLVRRDRASTGEGTDARGDRQRARQLALAINRAATRGVFRPRCLARSIALRDLLEREGIEPAGIRVGVRRDGARFTAHAWVVWDGQVLGDDPRWVARFTEVDDLRVLKDA
jgi:hypothetical protein